MSTTTRTLGAIGVTGLFFLTGCSSTPSSSSNSNMCPAPKSAACSAINVVDARTIETPGVIEHDMDARETS